MKKTEQIQLLQSTLQESRPEVQVLQYSGIGTSEYAARTCYDSMHLSENEVIQDIATGAQGALQMQRLQEIQDSELLDKLAWTYQHHSILEHSSITFLIKGCSRGVLQEHARHRIQSISVRSTRYTMSSVLYAFVASWIVSHETSVKTAKSSFRGLITEMQLLIQNNPEYIRIETDAMYDKLVFMLENGFELSQFLGTESLRVLQERKELGIDTVQGLYDAFLKTPKSSNIGDPFKHLVTDNWKVDMVVTFNLRSLKNYFDLRDSGAAYYQIRILAQEMKKHVPKPMLELIDKKHRTEKNQKKGKKK